MANTRICPRCGKINDVSWRFCCNCGLSMYAPRSVPQQAPPPPPPLTPAQQKQQQQQLIAQRNKQITYYRQNGIAYCPRCLSIHVDSVGGEVMGARDQKTKTRYTVNLNPFRPFTLVNKKEKVVRKANPGRFVTTWHCNDCGFVYK